MRLFTFFICTILSSSLSPLPKTISFSSNCRKFFPTTPKILKVRQRHRYIKTRKLKFENIIIFEDTIRNKEKRSFKRVYFKFEDRPKLFSTKNATESLLYKHPKIKNIVITSYRTNFFDGGYNGYNIYILTKDKIVFSEFLPEKSEPWCYDSPATEWSTALSDNRYSVKTNQLLTRAKIPNCEFNSSKYHVFDKERRRKPRKYETTMTFAIKVTDDEVNLSQSCAKDFSKQFLRQWATGKSFEWVKL